LEAKRYCFLPSRYLGWAFFTFSSSSFTSFSSSDDIMCPKGYKFMCGYKEEIGDYRCFCRKIYSGKN
jgi:hypothetical protein